MLEEICVNGLEETSHRDFTSIQGLPDVYMDETPNFRMYASRPFNPKEVLLFTSETNATRILKNVDFS